MTRTYTPTQRIRREIRELVEAEIERQGKPWYQIDRSHWPQCPLINPMCPDDLCVLPAGHVGTEHGYHVLGTTMYSQAERYPKDWLVYPGTSKEALIRMGWERQQRMFPDD